jgi:hypothetical protein
MKPASPALIACLNAVISGTEFGSGFSSGFSSGFGSSPMSLCDFDLYTITLVNGAVLRFTTADFDINCGTGTNFGGLASPSGVYSSGGIRIDQKSSKTQAHWKVGLDADQWTVSVFPRLVDLVNGTQFPDLIGNVPWIQAAMAGALDGADVQVDRAYFYSMPQFPMPIGGVVPLGTITIFAGLVAEIDTSATQVVITINDYRTLTSYTLPRHYFQGMCRHQLYDSGCNANGNMSRAAYAVAATAKNGSTQASIVASAPMTFPANSSKTFTLGQIQFTGGLNTGLWGFVVSWDGSVTMSLLVPMPFTVSAGDTFNVYPGCDKTQATCTAFNNNPQFGGEPNIPVPETLASGN